MRELPRLFWAPLAAAAFLFCAAPYGLAVQAITATSATPDGIAVNTPTSVTITAQISPDPTLIPSSVNLVSYNAQGQALGLAGLLYDDGTHGDQRAGDNMFTTQLQLNQPTPTQLFYKVSVAYKGRLTRVLSPLITIDVVQLPSPQDLQAISSTNQQAANLLTSVTNTAGLPAARSAVITWLLQQSTVSAARLAADGESISIRYSNGLYGALASNPPGSLGGTPSSTRGLIASPIASSEFCGPEVTSVQAKWQSVNGAISPDSPVVNEAVTINFMKTVSDYGVISICTHGMLSYFGEPMLMTADSSPILGGTAHLIDWVRGYLEPEGSNSQWYITPEFIKHYNATFPGSVVFLSACHSLDNTALSQAFIQKGAQVVFGWQHSVSVSGPNAPPGAFSKLTKDALMVAMLDNGMTAGQAYQAVGHTDIYPVDTPPAVLVLDGDGSATLVPGPPPPASPVNFTFTGVQGPYLGVSWPAYTGPYFATIVDNKSNVSVGVPVICLDFATHIDFGQSWTATVTSVASLQGTNLVKFDQGNAGKQQQDYAAAAFLAQQIFAQDQNTSQGQHTAGVLSFALWAIFDPGALSDLVLADQQAAQAALDTARNKSGPASNYPNVLVYTPTPDPNVSQEFLGLRER